ncbi:MAG: transglycosylase SLT domain-containing protein [Burkholderiaceae bacterium]
MTIVVPSPAPDAGDAAASLPPAQLLGRPGISLVPPGSLWDRIRAGFAMPELDTNLVAEKERFYLQRPDYLQRMFSRGSRYLYHIVQEIEKRGMPTELALLPFVESAMNPTALSSAQAAGLWQFIPSTGRQYNLQQDWWVDNRRDVVKSTQAALEYLQKIYEMHGNDWFLALASYNWGEGAVGRAIKRNQARKLPTDYLSLNMPAETRHYVPKLIALKNILMRADTLGLDLPELPNQPYFVTLEKTRPIDLKLAAQFAGMTVSEFVALNPAHNRPVIAASRNNQIKLPADRLEAFLSAVERHGESNRAFATWQPYTLKTGETLESLARRGGVTVAELRDANGLRAGQRLLAGTRLLAPQSSIDDESRVESFEAPRVYELVERPAVYHRVGKRETLASIARRYGTSVANLKAWNDIGNVAKTGTRLLVRQADSQTMLTTESGDRRVVHIDSDEPRIVRAVLRREAPQLEAVAPPKTAAAPSARRGAGARQSSAAGRSTQSTKAQPTKSQPAASRRTVVQRPATRNAAARPAQTKAVSAGTAKRAVSASAPRAAEPRKAATRNEVPSQAKKRT